MKAFPLLLAFLVALFVSSGLADDVKPVGELSAVIPQGIKLLEAKEHKTFLQLFIPPTDAEKVAREGGLDEMAKICSAS
jgi:hypothetical protein